MLIRKVEIGRNCGFPWRDLRVHVDRVPGLEEFLFEAIPLEDDCTLYVGTHGALVRQFVHNPHNETGFGRGMFTLRMRTGGEVTINGPWSSRASVTNRYRPELRCCEVVFIEDGHRCGLAGINVTESTFRELAEMAGAEVVEEDENHFYATVNEEV